MKNGILEQALKLSDEILSNIELSEVPLGNIVLKTSRLARLLDDFEFQKIFQYEYSGYPSGEGGIPKDIFNLLQKVNRTYFEKNEEGDSVEYGNRKSIESYEYELGLLTDELTSLNDAYIALANNSNTNFRELNDNKSSKRTLKRKITKISELISSRKTFIYNYVLEKNYELEYAQLNNDIFNRTQLKVDNIMMEIIPETIKKFTSVYQNLTSNNDEDWSNAVHSCRRILQDLADEIYPPCEPKKLPNGKKLNLGVDQYINRLVTYIEEESDSSRFQELVGSNLKYIGERLDSIFKAAQKGSHNVISSQDEADRYVIYTYLLVGDILRLKTDVESRIGIDTPQIESE